MIEIFKLFFGYFIIFGVRESDAAVKSGSANLNLTDDAVIIEANSLLSKSRSSRHIQYDSFSPISWGNSLGEGSPCLGADGRLGSCMSSRSCFLKSMQSNFMFNKWNDNSWLQESTDCTYLDISFQHIAGTCCIKKFTNPIENNDPFSSGEPFYDSVERYYQWPVQIGAFPDFGAWPPSIPASPPKQVASWPPPIPTHPPNHHYPTHPPSHGSIPVAAYPTTTHKPSQVPTTARPVIAPAPVSSYGECGVKNGPSLDSERIVGGQNSSPHEFPWIAVLFISGKQFCGASLIDNIHLLTAAHCVARMTSYDVAGITANLGDHNIRTPYETQHVERKIKRVVRHKGFQFTTLHNDIAVLTMDRPVKFTKEIHPVCLPSITAKSYTGHNGTVAGWGSLRENGPQPSILQKVAIPIWSNHDCARKYGRAAPAGIIDSMICAGRDTKDSCSGDSGGPMVIYDNGRWTQIGVVSWGIGCGKGQYPGVYSRVSSFLPWITKNLK